MKQSKVSSLFSRETLIALLGSVLIGTTFSSSIADPPNDMTEAQKMAKTVGLTYLETRWLKVESSAKLPAKNLPEDVKEESLKWFKTIINAKWFSKNLDEIMFGLKDFKLWENRDDQGGLISDGTGDYIVYQYDLNKYKIQILEDGDEISFLVIFPPNSNSPPVVGWNVFVQKTLKEFLKFPKGDTLLSKAQYNLKTEKGLCYGEVVIECPGYDEATIQEAEKKGIFIEPPWWEKLWIYTDGSFFFVQVIESTGGTYNPRACMGSLDRF